MIPAKRQRVLLDIIEENQGLTTRDLALTLHVSEMTVRRDIRMLDLQQRILKVRNGALLTVTDPVHEREREPTIPLLPEFSASVSALVKQSMVVGVQAGGAAAAIVTALSGVQGITLVTNWIGAASLLNSIANRALTPQPRLLLTPGSPHGHGELGGPLAVSMLGRVRTDIAFLNVCALRHNFGFSALTLERMEIAETLAGNSHLPVAVVGQDGPHRAGSFRSSDNFRAKVVLLATVADEEEEECRERATPLITT